MENFEVIDIVDETSPYPSLLGIDWVFDNNSILNLNNEKMTYELDVVTLVSLLEIR